MLTSELVWKLTKEDYDVIVDCLDASVEDAAAGLSDEDAKILADNLRYVPHSLMEVSWADMPTVLSKVIDLAPFPWSLQTESRKEFNGKCWSRAEFNRQLLMAVNEMYAMNGKAETSWYVAKLYRLLFITMTREFCLRNQSYATGSMDQLVLFDFLKLNQLLRSQ